MSLFKITTNQHNSKHFCLNCDLRVVEPEEVEFKDGFRCKDCAKTFRDKKKKEGAE